MNLSIFCLFAIIGFIVADDTTQKSRGCRYILGQCVSECEEGTHSYASGCIGPFIREATCDDPNPKPDPHGALCDFSDCYCDSPTVRDKTTNKCVPVDQCPKKE